MIIPSAPAPGKSPGPEYSSGQVQEGGGTTMDTNETV